MNLSYGNCVRFTHLILFVLSSLVCLFKPSTHSGLVAILSLIGFIAFDVIFQLKRKEVPDFTKEIVALQEKNAKLEHDFNLIKGNISVGAISAAIQRR